jgi:hypothetical protein
MNISKDDLYQKLIIENKTYAETAKFFKCSEATIWRNIKKHNIPKKIMYENLKGKQIGNWFVKELVTPKTHPLKWKCICKCGVEKEINVSNLRSDRSKKCKSCSGLERRSKDIIPGYIYQIIYQRCRFKNKELNIDKDYLEKLFLEQERKCALTGWEISFAPTISEKNNTTASLDRINSNLGYVKRNIQWLHKDVNMMKQKLSQDRFIEICKVVANHNKRED